MWGFFTIYNSHLSLPCHGEVLREKWRCNPDGLFAVSSPNSFENLQITAVLVPGPSARKDIHSETATFCCRSSQITCAIAILNLHPFLNSMWTVKIWWGIGGLGSQMLPNNFLIHEQNQNGTPEELLHSCTLTAIPNSPPSWERLLFRLVF